MADSQSIFEKQFNPVYQALFAFGGVVVIDIGGKLLQLSEVIHISQRFPWMTAAAIMLFFAVFNSVFSLSSENMMKYWGRSIYCFMGLAVASGLVAWLFSSLSIGQAGSYRWIFIVVTFGYLIFLTIMAMLRQIVEFAQREEWNHPRIRRKNKKP